MVHTEALVVNAPPAERDSNSPVAPQAAIVAGILLAGSGLLMAGLGFVTLFYNQVLPLSPNWVFRFDATWWASLFIAVGFLTAITAVMFAFQRRWAEMPLLSFASGSSLLVLVFCDTYPAWCLPVIVLSLLGLSIGFAGDRTLRRPA